MSDTSQLSPNSYPLSPDRDAILLGDCVDLLSSFPDRCVDLVFADPPYNLQLNGDLWRPNHTRVDAAKDDWDQFASLSAYDEFTRAWLTAVRRVMKPSATLWVMGSYHNIYRVGAILMDLGFWILNDVVWIKANPTPQMRGVRFCNAHETLLWAAKSRKATGITFHYKDLKAGAEDRQMRSDWYFPVCSGGERIEANGTKAHTTQKPQALLHRVLTSSSHPGDLVLDPFCGTGTTAAVAKRLGRHYITMDREQSYVNVALRRVADIQPIPSGVETPLLSAAKPRIPFLTVVEAGKLPPGTALTLRGAVGVTATVNADGTLTANGYRGSIHGVGAKCLNVPACNGWTSWYYTNPATGAQELIDALRPIA